MAKPNFRMNTRMVAARFWGNEDLAELAIQSKIPNLKLTMIGLWAFADEAGIFEWKPRVAASFIYPLEPENQTHVESAMNAFVESGFLKKIEVGGSWYGSWPNWGEHNSFRKNDSRYPVVAAALGYHLDGAATPQEPSIPLRKPLEGEVEGEAEALPPTQTTKHEADSVEGEQEKNNTNPVASTDSLADATERLAKQLFKLLDQPRDQIDNAGDWQIQIRSLLKRGTSEEEVAAVMEFAIKEDKFAAEYLTIAKEPMKSFVKTYDNILKGWKALQKGAAAAANREAKLAKKVTAPGSHANQSGFEL
jgi:hypothetical protein